jgi:hypothetical protein
MPNEHSNKQKIQINTISAAFLSHLVMQVCIAIILEDIHMIPKNTKKELPI